MANLTPPPDNAKIEERAREIAINAMNSGVAYGMHHMTDDEMKRTQAGYIADIQTLISAAIAADRKERESNKDSVTTATLRKFADEILVAEEEHEFKGRKVMAVNSNLIAATLTRYTEQEQEEGRG